LAESAKRWQSDEVASWQNLPNDGRAMKYYSGHRFLFR